MANDLIINNDPKKLPSHVANATGAGNENVSSADMAIPAIKLLQDLSPEIKKDKAEYVPGAEPGKILVTLGSALHDELILINLYYDHEYALFRKRKFGGGFHGAYPTADAAMAKAKEEGGGSTEMFEVVETGRHTVLIVNPETGELRPAILNMNSTKLKISRRWNTDLNELGGDRFSSVWKLSVTSQSNSKGDFYNYKVENLGWASEDLYEHAKQFYAQIKSSYEEEAEKARGAA